MKYQRLGKTDIRVSQVCLGCWAFAGDKAWGPQKDSDSIQTIHTAIDLGINFFDTAELYGNGRSEEVLGKALSGQREDLVIGTKVNSEHLSRPKLIRACEASLRRLRTDYIDLYHIHYANPEVPISETLETLEELQDKGKIRAIGVSNFGQQDLQELLTYGQVEVNQLPYSLLWRASEYEIIPICRQKDIAITCYSPLAQGLLTGKFHSAEEVPEERARTRHFSGERPMARHGEEGVESQTFSTVQAIRSLSKQTGTPMAEMALGWLLTREGVASVISGARNPEQVRQNAHAADIKLSSDVVTRLTNITEELKQKLGSNVDMYQSESRIH